MVLWKLAVISLYLLVKLDIVLMELIWSAKVVKLIQFQPDILLHVVQETQDKIGAKVADPFLLSVQCTSLLSNGKSSGARPFVGVEVGIVGIRLLSNIFILSQCNRGKITRKDW